MKLREQGEYEEELEQLRKLKKKYEEINEKLEEGKRDLEGRDRTEK